MSRVLIIKTGTTNPSVAAAHGDYDDWFLDAVPGWRARCDVVRPFLGEPLPDPSPWVGILITGSPLSVRDEAPWMAEAGRWALQAAAGGAEVLGVCFGHQLLGEALGGRVELNPAGREIGTVKVSLTDAGRADPLFEGLPTDLKVQATHGDVLIRPPEGIELLAWNPNTAWQGFAAGPRIRCVQFHPELPAPALRDLLASRDQSAEVWETRHGARILTNWDRLLTAAR